MTLTNGMRGCFEDGVLPTINVFPCERNILSSWIPPFIDTPIDAKMTHPNDKRFMTMESNVEATLCRLQSGYETYETTRLPPGNVMKYPSASSHSDCHHSGFDFQIALNYSKPSQYGISSGSSEFELRDPEGAFVHQKCRVGGNTGNRV